MRWRLGHRFDDRFSGVGPRIGFVGIHSGGRKEQAVSQNETLGRLFEQSGYRVRRSSSLKNPALRTAHQIVSILLWRRVDLLVIAVFSGRSFWIAELATRLGSLTGKRMVLFLHGGNLPVFGPEHRAWVERVFERADLVLAPSEFLADSFRDWGIDICVIPNVLDIENYEYRVRTEAQPNLLWMRTFHEHYDPRMAVRVFARVAQKYPLATMTMGGADHGLLEATRVEAVRLGVDSKIRFPGYMLAEAKRAAFAECDIYLNTNVVDNMPVSLIEACASGLVPVATAVGGIPALVTDGHDGLLVPAGDDQAMADSVCQLLDDAASFAAISAAARELAERSSWSQVQKKWEQQITLILPGAAFP
ncbi:MAG: glycosyltransferase family 4 protein [Microthrixaceae bacterium]